MPKKLLRSRTPWSVPVNLPARREATTEVATAKLVEMTKGQIRELEALGEDATVLKQTLLALQTLPC